MRIKNLFIVALKCMIIDLYSILVTINFKDWAKCIIFMQFFNIVKT